MLTLCSSDTRVSFSVFFCGLCTVAACNMLMVPSILAYETLPTYGTRHARTDRLLADLTVAALINDRFRRTLVAISPIF